MSTLSGSLNSSSTALINDIYLPLTKSNPSPERQLWISRVATVCFGVLQICIALASYYLGTNQNTVNSVLTIAGFALGPLLGLYFLAVFGQRVQQRAALAGFGVGVAALTYIAFATKLYGYWYAGVGAGITFAAGVVLSFVLPQSDLIDNHSE
jgi:Na+/proline symporter